jgi:hypothetical protein
VTSPSCVLSDKPLASTFIVGLDYLEMPWLANTALRSPCRIAARKVVTSVPKFNSSIAHHKAYLTSLYCPRSRLNIFNRPYQDLAPKTTPSGNAQKPLQIPKDLVGEVENVTNAEQRIRDWKIIRKLMVHVWPRNDWRTRGTVLFGFGLLIGGKVFVQLTSSN